MPIKRDKREDRMAIRKRWQLEAPFGSDEIAVVEKFSKKFSRIATIHPRLEILENGAKNVLKRAGLPDHLRHVMVHADGTWSELPSDQSDAEFMDLWTNLKAGESLPNVRDLVRDNALSDEWYAAEILHLVDFVQAKMQAGDVESVALFAMNLGQLIEEASLNYEWGDDAVRGEKSRNNTGGAERPDHKKERNIVRDAALKLVDEYRARNPNASNSAAHNYAEKNLPDQLKNHRHSDSDAEIKPIKAARIGQLERARRAEQKTSKITR